MNRIILGDNMNVLPTLPDAFSRLIYIDPPFNTGKEQKRDRFKAIADEVKGIRTGFGGRSYRTEAIESGSYGDSFDDYLEFLMPRIEAALHCLTPDGSLFVHLDWREAHHVKVALDKLLGRNRFMNEIIWAYDYGGRSKSKWSAKHDTILWYALDPSNYIFNFDEMDRIPYMAPGLVTKEKAAKGKTPTDVWWHTIVPTNGKEKTGYPTQKPLGVLNRIIKVHTKEGDCVLDFFAGSGTTGEAAASNGREFVLIDDNPEAVEVMKTRLGKFIPAIEDDANRKALTDNKGRTVKHSR
ncbi:MAG: site-specific DNA-methyltransferase [Planctomycetes bacterium]|nr:site-specific DNA-methyltransferase [Planctomycetota bacterium]